MPELPEVETVVRSLRKPLLGKKFTNVTVNWSNSIVSGAAHLVSTLPGKTIRSINRRGKYLKFELSHGHFLFLHLKMSGDLLVVSKKEKKDPHARTIFGLSGNEELRFKDTRKFGRVYLVKDENKVIGKLGPEPLEKDFTFKKFQALFHGKRGRLKPLLLNQEFIAGLGNIYVDESCFQARVKPTRKVESLKEGELKALYQAIRKILNKAIQFNGSTFDFVYRGGNFQNHFCVYDRKDEPCKLCNNPIKRIVVGSRSTHFCANCQR